MAGGAAWVHALVEKKQSANISARTAKVCRFIEGDPGGGWGIGPRVMPLTPCGEALAEHRGPWISAP
ncbi:hypothetical protein GCM10007235_03100 [Pseudoxanthomonas indica]|nr:hypothetical protein GCM10007235_03100 [Pseudoxanthomonas indica]